RVLTARGPEPFGPSDATPPPIGEHVEESTRQWLYLVGLLLGSSPMQMLPLLRAAPREGSIPLRQMDPLQGVLCPARRRGQCAQNLSVHGQSRYTLGATHFATLRSPL